MKKSLITLFMLFSSSSYAAVYAGLNYGYNMFSSDTLEDYKVGPKGTSYGGFIGVGRDFVGVEVFYQNLAAQGDIDHDGGEHTIDTNAVAMGAALRFSFELLYLRLGIARYTLDQSLDIADDDSRDAAELIYEIEDEGTVKSGVLYGVGLHHKFTWCRVFVDYSRYQINTVGNYDTYSVGASFTIPERWFNVGKY